MTEHVISKLCFSAERSIPYRRESALLAVIVTLLRRVLRTSVRGIVLMPIVLPVSICVTVWVGALLLLLTHESLINPPDAPPPSEASG